MNINDKINYLTLIAITKRVRTNQYGIFRCDCGTEKEIRVSAVTSQSTKSCGCHRKTITQKIGKQAKTHGLTNHPLYHIWSRIKLECNKSNNITICDEWLNFEAFYEFAKDKWQKGYNIYTESHYSPTTCQILPSKQTKHLKMTKNRTNKGITHGKSRHRLYRVWHKMKQKCYNKNADRYQEGIKVCDEFMDFDKFYTWAIEKFKAGFVFCRVDENKDFTPDNCQFLSHSDSRKLYDEKARSTNLSKYGVEYAVQNHEVKERLYQSFIKKYGGYPLQNKEIYNKLQQTLIQKYGVDHIFKLDKIKQQIIQTNIQKYGTPHPPTNNKEQNTLKDFINSFGYDFQTDRKILNGKEIDLYDDSLKLGIEYCGIYWHTENRGKDRNYHYNKYKICKQNNIRLITIFSDEWLHRTTQVKNFLKAILNQCQYKIGARKCTLQLITEDVGKNFIDQNHIQTIKTKQLVYFGLYTDQLVAVMSFGKHHRGSNELILTRLCYKDNYNIVGGASKLFKAGIKWAIENNYQQIISWSDNRWSNGKVYEKMGFNLDRNLKPDYSYVPITNPNERKSKQSMKKSTTHCPEEITEQEWAEYHGYTRIWDCGKIRWIYNI